MYRRSFLLTSFTGFLTGLKAWDLFRQNKQRALIHHVFFYLNEANDTNRNTLVHGLSELGTLSYIRSYHIGVPVPSERDVVVGDYDISWMIILDNGEDEKRYQTDPLHLLFIEKYKHLWKKVIVYDSETIHSK